MFLQALFGVDDPTLGAPLSAIIAFSLFLKVVFIIGGLLYLVFAFVVTRQIHIMKSTVITPLSGVIQILGYVHLLLAMGVLLFFITAL